VTPIDVVVFEFCEMLPTGNRWNPSLFTGPKNIGCLQNCCCCIDHAQNLTVLTPTICSQCSRFRDVSELTQWMIDMWHDCSRQPLMKLSPVNGVNVCELVILSEMDVFSTLLLSDYLLGRWTAVCISCKRYCHLLTAEKSFVA